MLKQRYNINKYQFFLSKQVNTNNINIFLYFVKFEYFKIQIPKKKNNFIFFNLLYLFVIFQCIPFFKYIYSVNKKDNFLYVNIKYNLVNTNKNLIINKLLTNKEYNFKYDFFCIYFQKYIQKKEFIFFFKQIEKNLFNLFNLFFL
jgi:hypothetical protein